MNSELDQRIQALREEMEQLEKQKQAEETQVVQSDEEAVRKRIIELQGISKDPYYSQFLGQLLRDLESKKATPQQIADEAERTYLIYQTRMQQINAAPQPVVQQAPPQAPEKLKKPEKKGSTLEFTIGAGLLGVVGALFLLIAFITFGLNYLEGLAQGIFLYVFSIVIILLSEFLINRKIPRFARGITGLGIGGLYASTIINFLYLRTINSVIAIVAIIIIAVLSILLSRTKDSTSIRLISFIGCYICFLSMGEFSSSLEFLVAVGTLFLVNMICVFFPNQKNRNMIHLIHMGINTFLSIVLAVIAFQSGCESIYIIFYIILNVILLNVVYLKQEKKDYNTILFCVELGVLGVMTTIFTVGVPTFFYSLNAGIQIYNRMITMILILAVCLFFYIFSKDRVGKIIQYYYFMAVALLLYLSSEVKLENLFGVLVLFVIAKFFTRYKETEVMNCIVTVFAFIIGLCYYDMWQAWILLGAFVGSIFFIKRWELFYQYTISAFLIWFVALNTTYDVFNPVSAAILLGLVAVFHFQNKKKTMEMAYNITNLCVLGILSLLVVFCRNFWSGTITMVVGAIYIILYLSPEFCMNIKKKYLVLAGYLTCMAFLIRFRTPIYTSILLMLVAIGCVAVGFKLKDRTQRMCGIVLALFVCIKLVLYDFSELESFYKTILFMVVGVITLAISLIYIQLEKNQNEQKEEFLQAPEYEPEAEKEDGDESKQENQI